MSDLIDRQAAIDAIWSHATKILESSDYDVAIQDFYKMAHRHIAEVIKQLPSVQSEWNTSYGYNIEHLELIASVLRKEDLPPERVEEVLTDIGRIVAMVVDEFEETLRKAVERGARMVMEHED